jgi:hypothetical protein
LNLPAGYAFSLPGATGLPMGDATNIYFNDYLGKTQKS